MKRTILIELTVDWEDYDDVCDELVLEDTGIYEVIKDGVSLRILNEINNNHENENG